jgi:hypothetical protein
MEYPSSSVQFRDITTNSVVVFWDYPTWSNPNEYEIFGYHLVLKNQDTGQTITEANVNTRSQLIGNLNPLTRYRVYLIVVNSGGQPETFNDFITLEFPVIPVIISAEVQIILNKFTNNDYTYPTWFNFNIDSVKKGSITSNEFLNSFNSLLQNGTIVDKTIVIPPIQLNPDNFLPNGNVRVIRVTGILANDYEVTDGVALANLQSYLDSGVFRLLTQAELDYVAPPVALFTKLFRFRCI